MTRRIRPRWPVSLTPRWGSSPPAGAILKAAPEFPSGHWAQRVNRDTGEAMEFRILAMVATAMEACMGPNERRRGHPPAATVRVLATLRQFLREGTPWRSLRASAETVSGSTLRRHLDRWAQQGLLTRVHAAGSADAGSRSRVC